jgi:hypothetical protein
MDRWIQTFDGVKFEPFMPRAEDVNIKDIAHSLAMICRFNGHCQRFYSVAEHCIHISNLVSNEARLFGLMHDAAEAYIGDIARPLKPHMGDIKAIEADIMNAVLIRFNIMPSADIIAEVKEADTRMLKTEQLQIMSPTPDSWGLDDIEPYKLKLKCWEWQEAEDKFLKAFLQQALF